jgi:hypothetical protein
MPVADTWGRVEALEGGNRDPRPPQAAPSLARQMESRIFDQARRFLIRSQLETVRWAPAELRWSPEVSWTAVPSTHSLSRYRETSCQCDSHSHRKEAGFQASGLYGLGGTWDQGSTAVDEDLK